MGINKTLQKDLAADWTLPYRHQFCPEIEDETLKNFLGGDPDNYDKEILRDAHSRAVLLKLELGIIAKGFVIKPASTKLKDRKIVETIETILQEGIEDKVCASLWEAIGKGWAFAEILWEQKDGLIVPHDIRGRPQWRFQFRPPKSHDMTGVTTHQGYEVWLTNGWSRHGELLTGDKHRKILCFSWGSKTANPHGRGLYETAWWICKIRKDLIKFSLTAADKYASPVPYASVPPGTNVDDIDKFLSSISQQAWGRIPDGVRVDVLESAKSGVADYVSLIDLFADELSKLFLGSTLTIQMGKVGSFAAVKAHQQEADTLVTAYAKALTMPLQQLINWICEINYPNVIPPKIFAKPSTEDLDVKAERDAKIAKATGKLLDTTYAETTYNLKLQRKTMSSDVSNFSQYFELDQPGLKSTPELIQEQYSSPAIFNEWNELIKKEAQNISTLQFLSDSEKYQLLNDRLTEMYGELPSEILYNSLGQAMSLSRLSGEHEITPQ